MLMIYNTNNSRLNSYIIDLRNRMKTIVVIYIHLYVKYNYLFLNKNKITLLKFIINYLSFPQYI